MSQYDDFAADYAAHAVDSPYNADYERPAMLAQLPDIAGKHVLDVACASGEYIPFLLERGATVTALDSSQAMLTMVRERFEGGVTTMLGDLNEGLPLLADGSCDLILSSLTVHYIANWNNLFCEFRRVLASGGMLLLSTHHPAMSASLVEDYFRTQRVTERWELAGRGVDVEFYHRPLQAMIEPLLQAGFTITSLLEPECQEQPGKPWFLILKAVASSVR